MFIPAEIDGRTRVLWELSPVLVIPLENSNNLLKLVRFY